MSIPASELRPAMDELTQEQLDELAYSATCPVTGNVRDALQAAYRLGQQNAEEMRRDAERWRYVRGHVSRIYNEDSMKMDGLRVEVYYDEPQPFLLCKVDKSELFDAAIDAAMDPRP